MATHEAQFILLFFNKYSKYKNFKTSDLNFITNNLWIRLKDMESQWEIDYELLTDLLIHHRSKLTYTRLCKIIYCCHKDFKVQTLYIIDKNPIHSLHIEKLSQLFPGSKFIVLVRDYRDQYLSMIKDDLKPVNQKILYFYWAYVYNTILSENFINNDNSLFIKYEDLILKTNEVLISCYSFLNLETTLKRNKNFIVFDKKNYTCGKLSNYYSKVQRDINPNNKSKWKALPSSVIKKLEISNGYIGQKFGYKSSTLTDNIDSYRLNIFQKSLIFTFTQGIFYLPILVQKSIYSFIREFIKTKNKFKYR